MDIQKLFDQLLAQAQERKHQTALDALAELQPYLKHFGHLLDVDENEVRKEVADTLKDINAVARENQPAKEHERVDFMKWLHLVDTIERQLDAWQPTQPGASFTAI